MFLFLATTTLTGEGTWYVDNSACPHVVYGHRKRHATNNF